MEKYRKIEAFVLTHIVYGGYARHGIFGEIRPEVARVNPQDNFYEAQD
jgi:hypothetical protein